MGHIPAIADAGYGYDIFGANADWVRRAERAGAFFYEHWFRVDSHGHGNIPTAGAAIVVANHGGTLPFDATMLWMDVLRRTNPTRLLRPIADHFVLRLPFFGTFATRTGAVGGSRANVRHLLERDELLLVFPEGVAGVGKNFRHRYELAEWRVGHAEFAIRHRVPVIPTAIVGAEEQMPQLARLPVHAFGIPHLPIALSPLPLPVRYHVRYGAPVYLYEEFPPGAADEPEVLDIAAARTKAAVRTLLESTRRARRGVFA
jgi:1-acyl-sn-glycerol-3-phosphate acyltransferase